MMNDLFKNAGKISPEERRARVAALQANATEETVEKVVEAFLALAVKIALRVARRNLPRDETLGAAGRGLMDAIKCVHRYKPEKGQFSTFLRPYVIDAVYETFRSLSSFVGPRDPIDAPRREVVAEEVEEPTFDFDDCRRVRIETMRSALERLTPDERWLLERRREGLTFRDIAKIMGVTFQRVKQREVTIHGKLRAMLRKQKDKLL